jgi:hypothetical protein
MPAVRPDRRRLGRDFEFAVAHPAPPAAWEMPAC